MNPFILKNDLYQLTMVAGYFHKGMTGKVVTCEAFARKLPPTRKFMIMAGTEEIRNFLVSMRFDEDDIEFLKSVPAMRNAMTPEFCEWLRHFRFSGEMWAMAEGEIVFPGEPLVRITAPLAEAQLAETFILSVLNHNVSVASKAARVVLAARGRPVLEFGSRRAHHEAAVYSARAAYIAGFSATSNVEAGRRFGIPVAGTMAHMWVMVHQSEEEAFSAFGSVHPKSTLLIDTYDTMEGIQAAIRTGNFSSIRIDSGDLLFESKMARHILDESGRQDVKIVVSSDLDEYAIELLLEQRAPVDSFGVGTRVAVPHDPPSLGIVYKVVYDHETSRPLIKRSGSKTTMPGSKQVFLDQQKGPWSHIVAIDGALTPSEDMTPLLDCHIRNGNVVAESEAELEVSRAYCNSCIASLAALPEDLSSLEPANPEKPFSPVRPHDSLLTMYLKAVG